MIVWKYLKGAQITKKRAGEHETASPIEKEPWGNLKDSTSKIRHKKTKKKKKAKISCGGRVDVGQSTKRNKKKSRDECENTETYRGEGVGVLVSQKPQTSKKKKGGWGKNRYRRGKAPSHYNRGTTDLWGLS